MFWTCGTVEADPVECVWVPWWGSHWLYNVSRKWHWRGHSPLCPALLRGAACSSSIRFVKWCWKLVKCRHWIARKALHGLSGALTTGSVTEPVLTSLCPWGSCVCPGILKPNKFSLPFILGRALRDKDSIFQVLHCWFLWKWSPFARFCAVLGKTISPLHYLGSLKDKKKCNLSEIEALEDAKSSMSLPIWIMLLKK